MGVEVLPGWVGLLDEPEFPGSVPFFESAFTGDGGFHVGVGFVPDEGVYSVLVGEAVGEVVFVLPDALDEVGGDAYVEGAVGSTGEDVYAGLFHGRGMVAHGWGRREGVSGEVRGECFGGMDSHLRGNDGGEGKGVGVSGEVGGDRFGGMDSHLRGNDGLKGWG